MSDFKLEVGMFIRFLDRKENIRVIYDTKNKIETFCLYDGLKTCSYDINKFNYQVSYTYDFKEIIYSNIKKEILTEEEKEIVLKWVDVVGRDRINIILFIDYENTYMTFYCTKKDMFSTINYTGKFKNVELDKRYTLEELGL